MPVSGWQNHGEFCSKGFAISTDESPPQARGSPVLNTGLSGNRRRRNPSAGPDEVERRNKAGESGSIGQWEGQVHLDGNGGLCGAAAETAAREV